MNDDFMSALPTPEAIKLLTNEFVSGKFAYMLIGDDAPDNTELDTLLDAENAASYEQLKPYAKFIKPCDVVMYDYDGACLYECSIDIAKPFNFYTYAIALVKLDELATLDKDGVDITTPPSDITLISTIKIAKTAFIAGVGGSFKFKLAVLGKKAQVIFQNEGNFMTASQGQIWMQAMLAPIISVQAEVVKLANELIKDKRLD